MSIAFSFEIPLPPKGCSPNVASHRHWRVRAKATNSHRGAAQICCLAAIRANGYQGVQKPIKIHADFFCARIPGDDRYSPIDKMNGIASLKAAVDGFVDAGLVPNDSHKWVSWGEVNLYRTKKAHQGKSGVVIGIEYVEAPC